MKLHKMLGLVVAVVGSSALAFEELDLDMTGADYTRALKRHHVERTSRRSSELQPIIDMGKRSLDWLKYINQFRPEGHKISLTSAATQAGFPIETPRKYNPQIIMKSYQDLLAELPDSIKQVVVNNQAFTQNPPVPDDEYAKWGKKVDVVYQIAARWLLMEPNLWMMSERIQRDIRGYYFLSKEPNLEAKLAGWNGLEPSEKDRLSELLIGLCINTEANLSMCGEYLKSAVQSQGVLALYQKYFPQAKATYDGFFTLDVKRDDVHWDLGQINVFHIPFLDPASQTIKDYLANNIEDEWRNAGFQLRLDFGNSGSAPHIVFEPGVTPHVNGLGGNEITMDSNQPLTEYDAQWTIRHEFGHVIGYPDCYVEFYDEANQVMISYQLDITNLMCSRRGKFKQVHYDELRRVYGVSL